MSEKTDAKEQDKQEKRELRGTVTKENFKNQLFEISNKSLVLLKKTSLVDKGKDRVSSFEFTLAQRAIM